MGNTPDQEIQEYHERVSEEIDPEKGISNELDRIFKDSDTQPTKAQERLTRNYYATGDKAEKLTFSAGGKEYVKIKENKYKRVDRKDEITVYNPKTGHLYAVDSNGDFREIVE